MFTITFEYVYYADRRTPATDIPDTIRAAAEQQAPMLHPERRHVLSSRTGVSGWTFLPLAGSAGWYATYTPVAQ